MPEPSHPNQAQPIDFREVLDRIGGDSAFLKELLIIYFQEYEKKKNLLAQALAEQNFTQLSELGHSLKGSSANLSLPRLRKTAYLLEMAGKQKMLQSAQEAVRAFEAEVETLKAFLAQNQPDERP